MDKGKIIIFGVIFLITACATRQRTTIPDYLILPEGKEVLGQKNLNAFIFENIQKDIPFQSFLMNKFDLNNLKATGFWVTIDAEKFQILIYDNSELEKYFHVSDFIITNLNPVNIDSDTPKFIALSMISSKNEDCLSDQSLYHNVAINYLKKLKEEYYKQ